jgi:hypothetical protein
VYQMCSLLSPPTLGKKFHSRAPEGSFVTITKIQKIRRNILHTRGNSQVLLEQLWSGKEAGAEGTAFLEELSGERDRGPYFWREQMVRQC